MRSVTHRAGIDVDGMNMNRFAPVEFDYLDIKSTILMKHKINSTPAALGFELATLTAPACQNTGDGSHNMGDNRNYKPMPNQDMPARPGGTGANSSDGSHNMGSSRVYEPMPNREMPNHH